MLNADEVRLRCQRRLCGHRLATPRSTLTELAGSELAELPADRYGAGEAIATLEGDVASLLGKPSALFVIKGVVAQQAALRAWCDRTGRRTVALHRKSHIDLDEHGGYERLHGLAGLRLGADHKPLNLGELKQTADFLGAVTIELPLRRAGFVLPEWEDLAALSEWCRSHGVPLHFDGARLWEAQPYYDRSLAEISGLADSVYVSLYKGLGGLGGAVLAGDERFIAEARLWHDRQCGPLMTAFPFVISAHAGLRRHLPRMRAYYDRAIGLATALGNLPSVFVMPSPPQSNSFKVALPANADDLNAAHLEQARDTGVWLFARFAETTTPAIAATEIVIGDAAEDFCDDEVVALVQRLLAAVSSK